MKQSLLSATFALVASLAGQVVAAPNDPRLTFWVLRPEFRNTNEKPNEHLSFRNDAATITINGARDVNAVASEFIFTYGYAIRTLESEDLRRLWDRYKPMFFGYHQPTLHTLDEPVTRKDKITRSVNPEHQEKHKRNKFPNKIGKQSHEDLQSDATTLWDMKTLSQFRTRTYELGYPIDNTRFAFALERYYWLKDPEPATGTLVYVLDSGADVGRQFPEFDYVRPHIEWLCAGPYPQARCDHDSGAKKHGTRVLSKVVGKSLGIGKRADVVMGNQFTSDGRASSISSIDLLLKTYDHIVKVRRGQHEKHKAGVPIIITITHAFAYEEDLNERDGYDHGLALMVKDIFEKLVSIDDVILVTAAGNDRPEALIERWPDLMGRTHPKVITVGGTDKSGANVFQQKYKTDGSLIKVWAPAEDVTTAHSGEAYKDNDYYRHDNRGTSFSAPTVAGLVAYLVAKKNIGDYTVTMDNVKSLIEGPFTYPRLAKGGPEIIWNGISAEDAGFNPNAIALPKFVTMTKTKTTKKAAQPTPTKVVQPPPPIVTSTYEATCKSESRSITVAMVTRFWYIVTIEATNFPKMESNKLSDTLKGCLTNFNSFAFNPKGNGWTATFQMDNSKKTSCFYDSMKAMLSEDEQRKTQFKTSGCGQP